MPITNKIVSTSRHEQLIKVVATRKLLHMAIIMGFGAEYYIIANVPIFVEVGAVECASRPVESRSSKMKQQHVVITTSSTFDQ